MNVRYTRRFIASLRALQPAEKRSVGRTLEWFIENPTAPGLHNHPLQGAMSGTRAIAVDGDLRIVFTERTTMPRSRYLMLAAMARCIATDHLRSPVGEVCSGFPARPISAWLSNGRR
jgi:mRNA-degrading endonuclease YafQ of YafQ-DinJ toxin-antitoxin module